MSKLRSRIEKILASYGLSFAPTEKQYGIHMEEATEELLQLFKDTAKRAKPDVWDMLGTKDELLVAGSAVDWYEERLEKEME
ncbi:MAG: hypothetical protein AABY22_28615 [Nanoarchaeota archaeon]